MPPIKSQDFVDPRDLEEQALPQDGRPRRSSKAKRRRVRSVTVNRSESPILWLYSRGHLTTRQLDGGEKLRADWERAHLAPSVTMRWDMMTPKAKRRQSPESLDPTEQQIAAKRRFNEALVHLGDDLCDIAWRVICAGEGVPVAEKHLGWPARSGKLVLKIALDRLADFYRLPEDEGCSKPP